MRELFFLSASNGIYDLLASLAPNLEYIREKENPGNCHHAVPLFQRSLAGLPLFLLLLVSSYDCSICSGVSVNMGLVDAG